LQSKQKKNARKDAKTQRNFLASFASWREYSSFRLAEIGALVC